MWERGDESLFQQALGAGQAQLEITRDYVRKCVDIYEMSKSRKTAAAPSRRLDLADFYLERAVVEVRYDQALLLFDRAGTIWHGLRRKYPKLEITAAQPNRVEASITEQYHLSSTLDKAIVADYKPEGSLTQLSEYADEFFAILHEAIQVVDYKRVGLRLIYMQEFQDRVSAAQAVLSCGLIEVPTPPYFGVDGSINQLEYLSRIEGKAVGAIVRLKTESRDIRVRVPPEIRRVGGESFQREQHLVVYDVDYYTVKPVSASQLSFKDWIPQGLHVVRRDSPGIIRGRI